MKTINKAATLVFHKLLTRMEQAPAVVFQLSQSPRLTMQLLSDAKQTQYGPAAVYQLSHFYLNENRDLMSDPTWKFLVLDKRTDPGNLEWYLVYPFYYNNSQLGKGGSSMDFGEDRITAVNRHLQALQAKDAGQWLWQIRKDNYLTCPMVIPTGRQLPGEGDNTDLHPKLG